MMGFNPEEFVNDIVLAVRSMKPGPAMSRLRIAISHEEAAQLELYFIEGAGRYHMRICNVPLVVEEDPQNPPLFTVSRMGA